MTPRLALDGSTPPFGLKWRSHTLFIVFTVGVGAFTDMFLYGLIVPCLPFILKDRINLPDSDIQSTVSNLLAIFAGASLAASPIAGILADKCASSRKAPFVSGLIMLMLATVLLAIGQSVTVLGIARYLQGASGGVVWTLGLTITIETVGPENLGKTMGTFFSFVSVAGFFSPIAGGSLYAASGYKGVFGVGIALVAVDLSLRLLMIEKKVATSYAQSSNMQPEAEIARESTDGAREDTEETPLLADTSQMLKRYQLTKPKNRITRSLPILLLLSDPGLITAFWISLMQAFLLGSFDATVPLVASEQFGFNSLKAGLLFLPLGGADFLLGPVFGWCVDHFGTRCISVIGFAALVPALVCLRLVTDTSITDELDQARHAALYAGLLAANGIGLAIVSSPSIVEAGSIVDRYWKANPDIFDQAPYAQLYGISSMTFSGGLMLGPLLAGHLREQIGYGNTNAVLGGICGLTAIQAAFFMGRK